MARARAGSRPSICGLSGLHVVAVRRRQLRGLLMMQLLTDPVLLVMHGGGCPIQELWLLLWVRRTVQIKCFCLVVSNRVRACVVVIGIVIVVEGVVVCWLRAVRELVPQSLRLFKHVLVLCLFFLKEETKRIQD